MISSRQGHFYTSSAAKGAHKTRLCHLQFDIKLQTNLFRLHDTLGVDTVGAVLGKVSWRSQSMKAWRQSVKQSFWPVSLAEQRSGAEHSVWEHTWKKTRQTQIEMVWQV